MKIRIGRIRIDYLWKQTDGWQEEEFSSSSSSSSSPFVSRVTKARIEKNWARKDATQMQGGRETRERRKNRLIRVEGEARERVYVNLITLIWRGCGGASCRTVYMCWLCIMHAYCVHLLPQIKVRLSCGNLMPHNCALNATTTRARGGGRGEGERRQKTKNGKKRGEGGKWIKIK